MSIFFPSQFEVANSILALIARTFMQVTLYSLYFYQIFVELERARLTKQLAEMKEAEGKIDEAAEIL